MGLLIIHIGAGNHSKTKRSQYKRLLASALSANGVREAATVIELSKLTNTGYGSSLDLCGCVECDASFIEVSDTMTSGALVGMDDTTTPIARMLEVYGKVEKLYHRLGRFGLTIPIFMNYGKWLQMDENKQVHDRVPNNQLILPEAQRIYDTYKQSLMEESDFNVIPELAHEITDTVGVIEIDFKTTIATSSGGNFFKLPGRIGCAGVIGSAIGFARAKDVEISCMCSGNGEDIMKMELANFLVNSVYEESEDESRDYGNFVVDKIKHHSQHFQLSSINNDGKRIIYVGVIIVVNYIKSGRRRIIYCHSTESFYFGYCDRGKPNIVASSLDKIDRAGLSFACGEFLIKSSNE